VRQSKNRIHINLKKINPFIMYVISFFAVISSIVNVITEIITVPFSIILYIFATISFIFTITFWKKALKNIIGTILLSFTKRNEYAELLINDNRFRTIAVTLPGMGLNIIFAIFNGVICITTHSVWYVTLFFYYTALYVMRFISVIYAKQIYSNKKTINNIEHRELNVYRNCGIILSVLSLVLTGTVIMITMGIGGKYYNKMLIYIVGLFAIVKLVLSIINMVKARKENSTLMITLRNIGYSDALVSMLFLQTSLITTYKWSIDGVILIVNTVIGTVVCVTALVLGLHMVWDSNKRFKILNMTYK